jgi:hypothetical protein
LPEPLYSGAKIKAVLFGEPRLIVKYSTDKVNYPGDRRTENDPKNTYDKKKHVVGISALDYSVNCPDNVDYGKAKNDLSYLGKVVDRFKKFLHWFISFKYL